MFDKVKEFLVGAIETGEFNVAAFLGLVKEALAAIFGFVAKEEGIEA